MKNQISPVITIFMAAILIFGHMWCYEMMYTPSNIFLLIFLSKQLKIFIHMTTLYAPMWYIRKILNTEVWRPFWIFSKHFEKILHAESDSPYPKTPIYNFSQNIYENYHPNHNLSLRTCLLGNIALRTMLDVICNGMHHCAHIF